jgi:hypothetical protein
VPAGSQTVRVTMLGFAPRELPTTIAANATVTVNFELKDIPYSITPVVTTALGIAREEKSLGYATTSISSTTLEKIPEPMMMQALAGQSAGLTMTSGSGRPGAGALINIRGASSFSSSGQPLFVIDGIPVSTNNDSRSDALGTGTSGSRQMDFDMENVEELTVLKGAGGDGALRIAGGQWRGHHQDQGGKGRAAASVQLQHAVALRHASPRWVHHGLGGRRSRLLLQRQERQSGRLVRAGLE